LLHKTGIPDIGHFDLDCWREVNFLLEMVPVGLDPVHGISAHSVLGRSQLLAVSLDVL